MKIAVFTDTYLPQINGVVTSTQTFAHELEKLGHKVLICGPKMKGGTRSTHKVWRFRSFAFPFQKEHRFINPFSRKLRRFKKLGIDVIHVQTPFSMGYLGQYLGWKYKIPVVHTYHTHWEEYLHYFPLLHKKLRKTLYILFLAKTFCNRSQHVIVPSAQMAEKLIEYGVTTTTTIIPTGIELNAIPEVSILHSFRSRFNFSSEDKIMIFVGRLGSEKNVYFLLEAAAKVMAKISNAKLLIVGDGPELQGLLAKAQELGVADHCVFTGYLTHKEVFTAYAASDVIAFPSMTETQGLSLLEGLSTQKPAVCINAMGVKDILRDEKGGFLTDGTVAAFGDRLIQLLSDSDLYQKKAQEAYEVAATFSSVEMTARLVDVYQQAIKKDGK